MNYKKGIRNISYSVIGQVASLALGIFIPRLVIVSYGSDVNGLLSSIGQVMTYLALLEAGLGAAAIQALYKPISQDDKNGISAIVSAASRSYKKIGYIYLTLIVCLSFTFPLVVRTDLNYWFIWVLVLINGMPGVINFLFQGKLRILMNSEGDGYVLTNFSTVITVFTSVMKIVLLSMQVNIVFVQLMYCGTSLVQMTFISWYVKKHYPWLDMKRAPDYDALKRRNPAFLHQICGLVTNSTDVMLLTVFRDLKEVSIYSVYNMSFNLVFNVLSSVTFGTQFMLGQEYYKDKAHYTKIINTYETVYMALSTALMLVVYVMITPFLKLYTAGADIDYINNAFPLLFFLVKILELYRNSAVLTASIAGHFEETKWHAIIESVINLGLSILFVNKYGMIGVLFGTVAAFVFRDVVSIIYSNRKILNRSFILPFKKIILNAFIAIIMMLCCRGIDWYGSTYLVLILKAIPLTAISVCVFMALNLIIDHSSYMICMEFIKAKVHRPK